MDYTRKTVGPYSFLWITRPAYSVFRVKLLVPTTSSGSPSQHTQSIDSKSVGPYYFFWPTHIVKFNHSKNIGPYYYLWVSRRRILSLFIVKLTVGPIIKNSTQYLTVCLITIWYDLSILITILYITNNIQNRKLMKKYKGDNSLTCSGVLSHFVTIFYKYNLHYL